MKLEITGGIRARLNEELRENAKEYNSRSTRSYDYKAREEVFDALCAELSVIGLILGGSEETAGFCYAPYSDQIARVYYRIGTKEITLNIPIYGEEKMNDGKQ